MNVAIIVAAGVGERFDDKIPKPFFEIKNAPIIIHTIKKFLIEEINEIILVVHKNWLSYARDLINFDKVKYIIEGCEHRQDSVKNGLDKIKYAKLVLIHDGVRPCITKEFIIKLMDEAKKFGSCIPVIPINFTIKEIKNNFVVRTVDRENLYETQTPQVFRYDIIKEAYAYAYKNKIYATDDAALVEKLGIKIKTIDGLKINIKITTKDDLLFAEKFI